MLPEERNFLPIGVLGRLESNAEYHKLVRGRPFHSIEPMMLSPAPSGAVKQVVGFMVERRREEDIRITQRDLDATTRLHQEAKERIRAVAAVARGMGDGTSLRKSLDASARHRLAIASGAGSSIE